MLKQKTAILLSFALLLISFTGCSPAPSQNTDPPSLTPGAPDREPVSLWFYYPTQVGGDLAKSMEEIVERFNTVHLDINVTAVYTGSYKQTAQKAMSDLAAGNGPNVILSGMLDIPDYYNVDKLENLTPMIHEEGGSWSSDFIDGFWGNFVMEDGGTYGLPYQHSICVLYCNKGMLDAANVKIPSTWEEVIAAEAALKAYNEKVVPIEFPSDVWVLEALSLSNSGKLIESSTQTAFGSRPVVDSLDLLASLIKGGGMISSYSAAAEDFVAESCAMMFNSTGNLGFVASDAAFLWDVAMVPVNTSPGFSYGGGGLVMTAGQTEAQKAASWEFMKYMTSPEITAEWMSASGYFAVRKSVSELQSVKDYYAENPQMEHAANLLPFTTAQWSTKNYWDVYACMQTALDSVLVDGSVSAENALAKAQADAMAALSK